MPRGCAAAAGGRRGPSPLWRDQDERQVLSVTHHLPHGALQQLKSTVQLPDVAITWLCCTRAYVRRWGLRCDTCRRFTSDLCSLGWQVVESQPRDADSEEGRAVRVSRLTLVDLAGSERLGKTGVHSAMNVCTEEHHTSDRTC